MKKFVKINWEFCVYRGVAKLANTCFPSSKQASLVIPKPQLSQDTKSLKASPFLFLSFTPQLTCLLVLGKLCFHVFLIAALLLWSAFVIYRKCSKQIECIVLRCVIIFCITYVKNFIHIIFYYLCIAGHLGSMPKWWNFCLHCL